MRESSTVTRQFCFISLGTNKLRHLQLTHVGLFFLSNPLTLQENKCVCGADGFNQLRLWLPFM